MLTLISRDLRPPCLGAAVDGGDGGQLPERAAGVERLGVIGAGPRMPQHVAASSADIFNAGSHAPAKLLPPLH
jgi:hypothetical protein